jgi:YD repeat-containing protein
MRPSIRRGILVLALLAGVNVVAQQHPNNARGFKPESLYQFNGVDSVNLFNGNLVVTIPVTPTFPIGGVLSHGLTLVYNGSAWDYRTTTGMPEALVPQFANAGLGWEVSVGNLLAPGDPGAVATAGDLGTGWVYASADAGRHRFYNYLHPDEVGNAGYEVPIRPPGDGEVIGYTRDSSYLRLRRVGPQCGPLTPDPSSPQSPDKQYWPCRAYYELEHPDGTRDRFESELYQHYWATTTDDEAALKYSLVTRFDRFGNHIDFKYSNDRLALSIEHYAKTDAGESLLRTITVKFIAADISNRTGFGRRQLVQEIRYPTTKGVEAVVRFHYGPSLLISAPCDDAWRIVTGIDHAVYATFLDSVELPDATSYEFKYEGKTVSGGLVICSPWSGHLLDLKLPTGGRVVYTAGQRGFPVLRESEIQQHLWENVPEPPIRHSPAVATRTMLDADGTPLGTWTYASRLRNVSGLVTGGETSGFMNGRARELVVSVVDPAGVATLHYFNVQRQDSDPCFLGGDQGEYGLPFTRTAGTGMDGLFLSEEVYAPPAAACIQLPPNTPDACPSPSTCTPIQRTFVKYDRDEPESETKDTNTRLIASRTVSYDGGCFGCYVETTWSDPDGLGHFRTEVRRGRSGIPEKVPDVTRTTFTSYGSTVPHKTDDWLVGLFDERRVTDSAGTTTTTSKTTFCVDRATGFVTRQRSGTGSSTSDVLAVFVPDHAGNRARESYFGGDVSPISSAMDCASQPSGPPAYSLTRTYVAGTLTNTHYENTSADSDRIEIDPATALVMAAFEPSGLRTSYEYDDKNRLIAVRPAGSAESAIAYETTSFPFWVSARQLDPATHARLAEERYVYDGFGRTVLSAKLMPRDAANPSDLFSAVRATYDVFGRKLTECLPQRLFDDGSGGHRPLTVDAASCRATSYSYDALGRVIRVTPPDHTDARPTDTEYVYGAPFAKSVKTFLGTSRGGQTRVTTADYTDALGRLVHVDEPDGISGTYVYDALDHLRSVAVTDGQVTQTRAFEYDSRGYLQSERHPENGTTSYARFDAMGHALQKRTGDAAFDLDYEYDGAARLTKVSSNGKVLKEFEYSTANAGSDYSLNKLRSAKRHNYLPIGHFLVEDRYEYADPAGRVQSKATSVSEVTAGATVPLQTFRQTFDYDALGNVVSQSYPDCAVAFCGRSQLVPFARAYENGWLSSINGMASITYHANGLFSRIVHANGIATTQETDAPDATRDSGIARPGRITVSPRAASCSSLTVTVPPASPRICAGAAAQLSVSVTESSAHYQWYEGASGDVSKPFGGDAAGISVSPAATTSYWVKVTTSDGTCSVNSPAGVVTVGANTVAFPRQPTDVTGPVNTALKVSAVAAGVTPLTVVWNVDGVDQLPAQISNDGQLEYSATSTTAGTRLVKARVKGGCSTQFAETATVAMTFATCGFKIAGFTVPDVVLPKGGMTYAVSVLLDTAGAYQYQWFRNGQAVPGATSGSLNVSSVDHDVYTVRVTSVCATSNPPAASDPVVAVTSGPLYVYVYGKCPIAPVKIAPDSVSIARNGAALLTAYTDWSYHLTYHWYSGSSGDTAHESLNTVPGHPEQLSVTGAMPSQYWVRITNECGLTRDSESISVGISEPGYTCGAVVVTRQPESQESASSAPVQLHLEASSDPVAHSYHWFEGPGETHPLAATNIGTITVAPDHTTTYWAKIISACAYAQTLSATVHVVSCGDDRVTVQPGSRAVVQGDSASLSVAASHPEHIARYDWYEGDAGDTTKLVGAGQTLVTVPLSATTRFWVRLTTAGGCLFDSRAATLSVCVRPVVPSNQPGDVNLVKGQGSLIEANATGTDLHYQWYAGRNTDSQHPLLNETGRSLYVAPDATSYFWVQVSNACGSDVRSRTATVSVCPTFTSPAAAAQTEVMPGTSTTLSVAASGGDLTYQWYRGGSGDTSSPISGATAATWTTPAITAESRYWVRVISGGCQLDSDVVTVRLCAGVLADWASPSRAIRPGDAVSLMVTTTPSPADGAQLYWYAGPAGNAAASTLVIGPTGNRSISPTPAQTTSYWVRVYRANCFADTGPLTVSVCIPVITTQPQGRSVNAGTPAQLSVSAAPSDVTYQWYVGQPGDTSAPIAGQRTATLTVTPSVTTTYWVRVAGTCNASLDSAAATVAVCQPPVITSQPAGASIQQGQSRLLAVTATGTALTYQWFIGPSGTTTNGVGNTSTLTVTPQDVTDYWVRVSGSCGTVNSQTAHVSVCAAPSITTQPISQTIFSGSTATLTAAASEATTQPIAYQWYRGVTGDVSSPVGTGASYVTPALTNAASYWVRATSGVCSTDSQAATISICTLPQNIAAPADAYIALGQVARLTVSAPGVANPTTRWFKGAAGDTTTPVTNWTPQTWLDAGPPATTKYWAQVGDGSCISSTAAATVNVCVPAITQQPAGVTISGSQSARLTVAATNGVTYQWYAGASGTTTSPVGGATSATLTITPSTTTSYWARVTGSCQRYADSAAATVTVCQPPVITGQVLNMSPLSAGNPGTLSVTATGTSLTYQWYRGASGDASMPVSGGTSTSVTSRPLQTEQYWVRITGACGSVNSAAGYISVYPTVDTQPQSARVAAGTSTSLSVAATGTYLHYAWKKSDGTAAQGATDSPYYVTPAVTSPATYYCTVTSGIASRDTAAADITVCNGPVVTLRSAPSGAGCRQLDVSIVYGGNSTQLYSNIYIYRGVRGDTSNLVATDQSSINACPGSGVTATYWARVTGCDQDQLGPCSSDSAAVTITP